ncbi:hypothetical protein [Christiangramia sp. LLG6405-1]|uniref:hypothetical protein n=1 Tax=Christiangramia sp. LLG6405-1 TaxID=3160832 RepID=UPI0038664A90
MKSKIILAVTAMIMFISCQSDQKEQQPQESNNSNISPIKGDIRSLENLNISFLLDLSDRIDPEKYPNPAMNFYERDASYINSVAEALRRHLNSKRIRQIDDRIQLYFEPEPSNPDMNVISEELKFNFSKENISKDLLKKFDETYESKPRKIYELAIKDNNYIGSDTWRFFKNKVDDYCIEEGYRNILVVLTDGYIFHKDTKIKEGNKTSYLTPEYIRSLKLNTNNWRDIYKNNGYGYIPLDKDLSNLEILVLGINPDTKNDFEEEIIRQYWTDWLQTMNVKRFKIMKADLPSNMDEIIKDFI